MNDRDTIKLNTIQIPKRFMLMGEEYTVQIVPELVFTDGDKGSLEWDLNIIRLQPSNPASPLPQDKVEHVFFHELLHAIFYQLGRAELRKDEELVEQMAGLLHQAFKTAEY